MVRALAVLFLAAASCMELRETVERMVMVRTSGSDLQPAATGFIYKKDSDGPASVVEMGETEVMEHLSKLYEQPETYAAPIPVAAGPFYAKEDKQISSDTKVIPVVENQASDDHVDGIADDYSKIFSEYASDFGDYNSDFDEYLKSLGHFHGGLYHGNEAGSDDFSLKSHFENGNKDQEGFGKNLNYENGDGGDYHSAKFESYKVSEGGESKKNIGDAEYLGKLYADGHGYKEGEHGHKVTHAKDANSDGFRKLFDKDEYKKENDFYNGKAFSNGFLGLGDGHGDHGAGAGHLADGDAGDAGRSAAPQHSAAGAAGDGDQLSETYYRNSFGYNIKH